MILQLDNTYYPIKIKGGSHVSRKDIWGITAFRNTYPSLRIGSGLVIYLGDKIFPLTENDYALPFNVCV